MKKLAPVITAILITMTATACSSGLKTSTKKDIQSRMKSKHDAFQGCYEQALEQDKELEGKMTVRFMVAKNGKFKSASITESTIPDDDLKECVVSETEQLKLKKPDKKSTVLVTYKLNFERNVVTYEESFE